MMNLKNSLIYLLLACNCLLLLSCNDQIYYKSPDGYDLNHPVKVDLESQLDEISGIVYYAKDTSIFAISDATGSLYKIFPDKHAMVQKWKFGKNHDYEDLQLLDSTFYILSSSGDIVGVKFTLPDSMQVESYQFPDNGHNEFETLYYDSAKAQLILICKDCKSDNKNYVGTWAFNPSTKSYQQGFYKIDYTKLKDNLKEVDKSKLKPSAAAINPLTHELYILASINKLLIIADKNGNIKNIYALNPSIYNQAEGIAFTPAGDLLISNESDKQSSADILVIKLKKKVK
jgi:uncharacterized protein YjiK